MLTSKEPFETPPLFLNPTAAVAPIFHWASANGGTDFRHRLLNIHFQINSANPNPSLFPFKYFDSNRVNPNSPNEKNHDLKFYIP